MRRSAPLACTLALLLGACAPPKPAHTHNGVSQLSASDLQSAERGVDAVEAHWNADLAARDAAKVVRHYSPYSLWVAESGVAPLHDAASVQARLTQLFADPNFSLVFAPDVTFVSSSDDLAYTRGHFTETLTDAATQAPITVNGAYVTVYLPDGAHAHGWVATEHVASSNGAAIAPGS